MSVNPGALQSFLWGLRPDFGAGTLALANPLLARGHYDRHSLAAYPSAQVANWLTLAVAHYEKLLAGKPRDEQMRIAGTYLDGVAGGRTLASTTHAQPRLLPIESLAFGHRAVTQDRQSGRHRLAILNPAKLIVGMWDGLAGLALKSAGDRMLIGAYFLCVPASALQEYHGGNTAWLLHSGLDTLGANLFADQFDIPGRALQTKEQTTPCLDGRARWNVPYVEVTPDPDTHRAQRAATLYLCAPDPLHTALGSAMVLLCLVNRGEPHFPLRGALLTLAERGQGDLQSLLHTRMATAEKTIGPFYRHAHAILAAWGGAQYFPDIAAHASIDPI